MSTTSLAASRRQRGSATARILAVLALLFGAIVAYTATAAAVHDDDVFELEGNALDDPDVVGHDWESIFDATDAGECDPADVTSDSAATLMSCSFANDGLSASIFTTGGSKDELDTSSWRHTNGSVPDKDNILNGYAARYDNGALYFGADRRATNGDAQIGFWFFQNPVVAETDGTFTGLHTAGDILVLSNFTNGGSIPQIRVFVWNGVGDVDLLPGVPTEGLCDPDVSNDNACAITSGPHTESPWPFVPKGSGSQAGFFNSGSFYEGGIDLGFLGLADECFSSFLVETRSSTSISSTLKDFSLGDFANCGSGTVTTPRDSEDNAIDNDPGVSFGEEVHDSATVTVSGIGEDDPIVGTLDFYLCGPVEDLDSCDPDDGVLVSSHVLNSPDNPVTVDSDGVTPTEPGDYCFAAVYSGDPLTGVPGSEDGSSGECFSVNQFQPTLSTEQSWIPNDTMNLDAGGGDALKGTAHFALFNSADCGELGSDLAVYSEDVAVDEATSTAAASTSNTGDAITGYVATASGDYSWLVSYTSDLADQLDIDPSCVEVTSLTIANS